MFKKVIIILFDYNFEHDMSSSYIEVLQCIERNHPIITTNCLDFFRFSMLDKGYEVVVSKSDGSKIILSELLSNPSDYTKRQMKKWHNAHRLLVAGEFNFKK